MLKVRFLNFWPGFVAEESLFFHCLKKITDSNLVVINDSKSLVDLQFESVYPGVSSLRHLIDRLKLESGILSNDEYSEKYRLGFSRNSLSPSKRRVWYTAENLRAPHGVYDLTIGFDQTDSALKNLYFPFWMYRLDWGMGNSLTEIAPKPQDLVSPRIFHPRPLEACAFSSTRNLTRMRTYAVMQSIMKLDLYGSAFNGRVDSKSEIANKYLYQVCPENSISLGYVTEKLVEAWAAGNIPIWQGLHFEDIFNPSAYIDVTGLSQYQIQNVFNGLTDQDLKKMYESPLLLKMPNIENLVKNLTELDN